MTSLQRFLNYQDRLKASVESFPGVIGLLFLGSAAAHERVDKYSDQDFFLMVEAGLGEQFRQDLSWLPDGDQILLRPRETDHGLKVLYQDGRVLEFAVFEDPELELATVNDYLVTLDRATIQRRVEAIAAKEVKKASFNDQLGLFLSLLVIGLGRHLRGEQVAGHLHIKSYAVEKLALLVRLGLGGEAADSLNPVRRLEIDHPAIASAISSALLLDSAEAAVVLAEIALEYLELSAEHRGQVASVITMMEEM